MRYNRWYIDSVVKKKMSSSLTHSPFFLLQVSALHIVKLSHTVGKSWLFPPWKLPRFGRLLMLCYRRSFCQSVHSWTQSGSWTGYRRARVTRYICRYYVTVVLLARTQDTCIRNHTHLSVYACLSVSTWSRLGAFRNVRCPA